MLTAAMIKKQPVPESSRFNWKNGFYSPEKIEIYKAMNEKAEAEKSQGKAFVRGGKARDSKKRAYARPDSAHRGRNSKRHK